METQGLLTREMIERDLLQIGEKYNITIFSRTEGNLRGQSRNDDLAVIGCYPEHYLCLDERGNKISLSKRDQYLKLWKVEVDEAMAENIEMAVKYYVEWLKKNPNESISTRDVLEKNNIGNFNNYYIQRIITAAVRILRDEGFEVKLVEFCRSSKKGPHLVLVTDEPDPMETETYIDEMAELIHERLETEKMKSIDEAYEKRFEEEKEAKDIESVNSDIIYPAADEGSVAIIDEPNNIEFPKKYTYNSGQGTEEVTLLNIENASIGSFDTAFMISLNETISMLRKLNGRAAVDIRVKAVK